ncbi:hypothetical protein CK203_040135 [Vitis vinifera]|uniref:Uncharacterized protein n=1 Tax=Vitis vinifera TaxID=29760 RepID=A0A438H424_VITVI|nr:hypothetical protein CK203_040135 [Vitis vinifera]
MQLPAGKTVGKRRYLEKFAGKVAGGECFLTTIRPTGKLWGLGKVTGMKHDHRKWMLLVKLASQLGKKDWNFSLNPCDGNSNWSTPIITEKPLYGNNVSCNCSYPNGECHVVNMYVSFSYYHYKLLYISIS